MNPLLLADMVAHLGRLVVNVFAVAGGFLVGYILTGLLVKLLCHLVAKKQAPRRVQQVLRALGGLALAILVALFVFGKGDGWGLGGSGIGAGDSKTDEKGKAPTPPVEPNPPVKEPPTKDTPSKPEESLRVVLLGGNRVKGGRIFEVEGEGTPRTLAELKDAIGRRVKQADPGKPLKTVELLVYPQSVPPETPEVGQLREWAGSQGLGVKFPPVSGDLP
jgi:hypothetical protein